jgi:MFS family permease
MAMVAAVQGAYWPLLAVHLHDMGIQGRWRGAIFATLALGSIIMPLGAGQLVDRLLPTQRFLALAYALGAGLLAILASGAVVAPTALFAFFLVYWLVIAPTIGLSAALALRNLPRPGEQFGGVRLWGTIGWMAAGWIATGVMTWSGSTRAGQGTYAAFGLAATLAAVLSLYCLTLPNTPPLAVGARGASGPREALDMLRRPVVASFLVTAFGVCLTTPYLYQVIPPYLESRGLARPWISTVMTLGQVPEIAALAGLPWMFRRFGYRGTLAIGISAYGIRYASLALDPPLWVAIAGIPLQGVGVACFTVAGQVFFDAQAPPHRRAGAQALLMVFSSGIGSLLGSLLAGEILNVFPGRYPLLFLVPCLLNFGLLAFFWPTFRSNPAIPERSRHEPPAGSPLLTEPGSGAAPMATSNLTSQRAEASFLVRSEE